MASINLNSLEKSFHAKKSLNKNFSRKSNLEQHPDYSKQDYQNFHRIMTARKKEDLKNITLEDILGLIKKEALYAPLYETGTGESLIENLESRIRSVPGQLTRKRLL